MHRQGTSARLVAVALGALALTAAACSDMASPSYNTTENAPTTTAVPAAGTTAIPVTLSTSPSSGTEAIVHVRVGGGPLVPVILDTGSAGLAILPADVGSAATSTGQTQTVTFGGGVQVTSSELSAKVAIGGVSTPSDIDVSEIRSSTCEPGFPECRPGSGTKQLLGPGVVGILGVAMTDGATATTPYSPLLQLRAPYRNGFTLSLPSGGPDSLTLGTPRSVADTVALPMVPATPATYPNGVAAWQKDVNLCWTINNKEHGCGSTDLDTGTSATIITPTGIPGLPSGGGVNPGYPISVTTASGEGVWNYDSTDTSGAGLTAFGSLPGTTQFNTGIGFFTSHVVGYNAVTGQILVTSG